MSNSAIPVFFSLTLASCFVNCTNQEQVSERFLSALQESIETSNTTIHRSTEMQLKDLDNKSVDYCTKERANVWFPKAKAIAEETKHFYDFVEKLKGKEHLTRSDCDDVIDRMEGFKMCIFWSDEELKNVFATKFHFINEIKSLVGADTLRTENSYTPISRKLLIPVFTKLQNEIKKVENKAINYCNIKVGCNIMIFEVFEPLVGQSSNYLKPGSKLEIYAGIGAFSKSVAMPAISINNRNIPLGEGGYSHYMLNVPKTPGKYGVPVRIRYFNHITGKEKERRINIEYTVVDTCRF